MIDFAPQVWSAGWSIARCQSTLRAGRIEFHVTHISIVRFTLTPSNNYAYN